MITGYPPLICFINICLLLVPTPPVPTFFHEVIIVSLDFKMYR